MTKSDKQAMRIHMAEIFSNIGKHNKYKNNK